MEVYARAAHGDAGPPAPVVPSRPFLSFPSSHSFIFINLFPDPLQTSLSSAPQVSTSDHKPVIGAFSVRESPPVATLDAADADTRAPLIRVSKLRAKGLRGESGVLGQHATPSHPTQSPPARAPPPGNGETATAQARFARCLAPKVND